MRTDQAWIRSGLAVALVIAVALRRLAADTRPTDALTLILLGGGLFAWSAAFWATRRFARSSEGGRAVFRGSLPLLVTAGTVLVAAAGFTLVLLPGP